MTWFAKTGRGALTKEDIELLRSGFIVILPRRKGGLLALIDLSRLPRPLGDAFPRILLYISMIHQGQGIAGMTCLHVVTSAKRPRLELQRNPVELFRKALPGGATNVPKLFVAQAYEEGKQHLIDFMGYEVSRIEEFRNKINAEMIAGTSFANTLSLLELRGLERDLLPRCLGGSYDYRQYDDFIRTRLSIEGIMSAAPIFPNNLALMSPYTENSAAIIPRQALRHTSEAAMIEIQPTAVTEEPIQRELDDKKRRALHARQFRRQKKDEKQSLESQRSMYLQQNELLRKDNRRLEAALAQARLLVATQMASSAPTTIDLSELPDPSKAK